jgi:hypothetical protein
MAAAPRLSFAIVPTTSLTSTDWDDLWQLTDAFFETDRGHAQDAARRHASTALVRTRGDGRLVGSASISVHHVMFGGRMVTAIYTSQVLLRPEARGRNVLQKIGFRCFLAERLRHPFRRIYWFFDTFGWKSYLLLPRNFRDWWPRHDRPTPAREQSLIDRLATRIYGADWRPAQGIVVRSGRKRLRPSTAPLEGARASSDVDFFVHANPGHAEGDMLVCLCPLSAANWLSAGVRALVRGWRRWRRAGRPAGG